MAAGRDSRTKILSRDALSPSAAALAALIIRRMIGAIRTTLAGTLAMREEPAFVAYVRRLRAIFEQLGIIRNTAT